MCSTMTHPPYLRAKAREMRVERRMTIDEIAERLALSRTTVFHWVRDLPIARDPVVAARVQRQATRAMQAKYRLAREAAYEGPRQLHRTGERSVVPRLPLPLPRRGLQAQPQPSGRVQLGSSGRPALRRMATPALHPGRLVLRAVSRGPGSRCTSTVLGECARHRSRRDPPSAEIEQQPACEADLAVGPRRADRRRERHAATRAAGRLARPAPRVVGLDSASHRGVAQPG